MAPICPNCRCPRRPAHVLARAIRQACIALRDASHRLEAPRPQRERNVPLATGDIDRAREALEAVEECCGCPLPVPNAITGDGFTIAPASSAPPDMVPGGIGHDPDAASGAE